MQVRSERNHLITVFINTPVPAGAYQLQPFPQSNSGTFDGTLFEFFLKVAKARLNEKEICNKGMSNVLLWLLQQGWDSPDSEAFCREPARAD